MDQITQSDKLIQELIEIKAINPDTNIETVKLILRKYLCESFADGTYHQNHKNYIEAKNK